MSRMAASASSSSSVFFNTSSLKLGSGAEPQVQLPQGTKDIGGRVGKAGFAVGAVLHRIDVDVAEPGQQPLQADARLRASQCCARAGMGAASEREMLVATRPTRQEGAGIRKARRV